MQENIDTEPVSKRAIEDGFVFYRHQAVQETDFSDENTFQIAASSEFPGEQIARAEHARLGIAKEGEKFTEILSHEPGDVDLKRFNPPNRASFIDEHVDKRHLGPIVKANLSKDKVVRVVAQCDRVTKLSKTRCKQIRTGSRPNVSIGYSHTKYLGTRKLEDGTTGHVFAWRGLELSSTAVPLDPTVGLNRSKTGLCHCFDCGAEMKREEMKSVDGTLICPDCAEAEDPAEDERSAGERLYRSKTKDGENVISHRELQQKVVTALDNDKRFKSKSNNGDMRSDFRLIDVKQIVGDGDQDDWQAHVESPTWRTDSKNFLVDFTFDGSAVQLGEAQEVEAKQILEPVERSLTPDGRIIRDGDKPYGDVEYADPGYQKDGKKRYPINTKEHAKAAWSYINQKSNADKYSADDLAKVKAKIKAAGKKFGVEMGDSERSSDTPLTRGRPAAPGEGVDSPEFLNAGSTAPNILTRKNMADKTPEQIAAEQIAAKPELVIDSLDNPHVKRALADRGYRTKVELDAEKKSRTDKFTARNKEITDLETEFCRDYGARINYRKLASGGQEAFYLRDAIHIAAMEACGMDDSKPDHEIRGIFRSKVDDLKRDSVTEENIKRNVAAAELGLAGRCDDPFAVIKRTIDRAHKAGTVSTGLMPDGAELEYSDEMRKQFRNMPGGARIAELGGFMTPPSCKARFGRKMAGSRMTRDALAGDFVTAGAMIAPEFHPYIELLRNDIVLTQLGCTYIGGLMGDQVFPRQEAATIAQSVAEGSQLAAYDQVLGQIKMSPHRVGSRQYYSRLAVIQAPPDFEQMVWNDHSRVLALYEDEMGLNGTGAADQPIGILNQPGINQLIFGGTPTYAQILNFRTQIRKFNVKGPLAFVTTSVGQGRLAYLPAALSGSTVITQGELDALWKGDEINGNMIGCKALASQQIPGDILLAGVFEHLILGSWGGIFTLLDNYTRADRDEVAITFNTYFDVAVRHAQAFTRSLDTCNQ